MGAVRMSPGAMRFAGKRADHTSLRPNEPSSTPWTIECRPPLPAFMRPRMNNTALRSPAHRRPPPSGTPVSCMKPSGRLVYLMSPGSVVSGASRCTDSSDANVSHSSYVITRSVSASLGNGETPRERRFVSTLIGARDRESDASDRAVRVCPSP